MKSDIDVLVIGHMTVDLVPGGTILGGTVAYAAAAYAAFGHRVGILTSAAFDEPLLGELMRFGKVVCLPAESSLTYENVYDEAGRKQYVRSTARFLGYGDVPLGWANAPFVHLGPLAAELDPLEMAGGFPNATVMLTLQGMMRRWGDDGLVRFRPWFDEAALRSIDIIVYSEEDVTRAPRLTDEIRAIGNHLVVTNGRHGGTWYHGESATAYASLDVVHADLTGAGDIFAASLLGVLPLVDNDMSLAVAVAGRLAAYSVTRVGLDSAPSHEEIERELAHVGKG